MEVTTPATSEGHAGLALPSAEACGACGAALARDQRYCVECGSRRGEPRLPFMDGRPRQAAPTPAAAPVPPRRRQSSAGATLVAGVGTLVLALGVGVLIGRSGGQTRVPPAAPVQVVTVAGGGAASADTSTTTSGSGGKQAKAHKTATPSVLPRSKLPPPTVTIGARGHGPGFRGGRFTGDFFGP